MRFTHTDLKHLRTKDDSHPEPGEPIAAVLSHGDDIVAHQTDPTAIPVGAPVITIDVPPWRSVIAEIFLRKF